MAKKHRRRPPPGSTITTTDINHLAITTDINHLATTTDINHLATTTSSFPSPCPSNSSSSSSDFEFAISLSPTSTIKLSSQLIPADELFYKGQLLPLQLSPRISMVRNILLASSSGSSSDTSTTADSRDSSGSRSSNDSTGSFSGDLLLLAVASVSAECDSSRPSSVTEDDAKKVNRQKQHYKYFSSIATKFSSVFNRSRSKEHDKSNNTQISDSGGTVTSCHFVPLGSIEEKRRMSSANFGSSTAKEVIKKYVRKVKPLYEKLSSNKQSQQSNNNNVEEEDEKPRQRKKTFSFSVRRGRVQSSSSPVPLATVEEEIMDRRHHSSSFSGNLKYPRRKRCSMAASCPSSIRSSPNHSGLLTNAMDGNGSKDLGRPVQPPVADLHHHHSMSATSMEELQSAIQGAIAHCKNSMAAQPTDKN